MDDQPRDPRPSCADLMRARRAEWAQADAVRPPDPTRLMRKRQFVSRCMDCGDPLPDDRMLKVRCERCEAHSHAPVKTRLPESDVPHFAPWRYVWNDR